MSATVELARIGLRRGWRSLIPIVLLVAVVSAIVLWSSATARRTDTAFDRMLETTDAFHLLVNPDNGSQTALTTDDLLGVDGVADASRIEAVVVMAPDAAAIDDPFAFPGTVFASDGGSGWRLARPIMVAGRFPDPSRVEELFVDVELAALLDVDVGDVVVQRALTADGAGRLLDLREQAATADPTELDAAVAALLADERFAPVIEFEVTGIGQLADMVVVDSGFELPLAIATPALFDRLGRPAAFFGGWHVRLDDPGRVDEFRDSVDALVPDESIVYQTMANVELKAERATSTPGGVMAIFAVTVLLLGSLLVWQSVQRWLGSQTIRMRILTSIGAGRRELAGSAIAQVAVASVVGFVLGAVAAVAASPLAPVGPARLVEVDPGISVDLLVLGWGLAALLAVVAGCAALTWRAVGRLDERDDGRRRSVVSRSFDAVGLPLPVATGVHFALDPLPGRRGSSRLAVAGASTGVVVAVAALVFTASIDRVTSTPRLYGTDWNAVVRFDGEVPEPEEFEPVLQGILAGLAADPDVRRASALHADELSIDGTRVPVVAYRDSDAPVGRTIAQGRAPSRPDEIALGRASLDALGVAIGDQVTVATTDGPVTATVVGRAVLPAIGTYSGADKTAMGEGAIVDASLLDPFGSFHAIALELEPGADVVAVQAGLETTTAFYGPLVEAYGEPAEVDSLRALAAFPRWLAAALAVLVGIPVVHSLLVSIRGRRRDLAVLSALGARPATLRSIGLVQGLTVVAAGVVIGLPFGVVAGRLSWSTVAEAFGTIPEPVVPVAAVGLLAVSVLIVGALVGGVPTWRTNRRAILRSLRPE